MMLYVKQKPFSWMDHFWVKDGKGADRYFVEGELIPAGHKLHIYDLNKKEIGSIQNKLSGLSPKVVIRQNDGDYYELDISNTADELKVLSTALTLSLAFEGVK